MYAGQVIEESFLYLKKNNTEMMKRKRKNKIKKDLNNLIYQLSLSGELMKHEVAHRRYVYTQPRRDSVVSPTKAPKMNQKTEEKIYG